ncbi:RNA polymerase sigma factor [Candidatus Dojkabacteria bacterium]|nr:RNA polymerase sigma factor [Candidatus Dojkabacteria bacterium]
MQNDQVNEKQLIEAARADISNFKFLYEKYVKAVYRYSYHRLGKNKELAEDVASETFVKAIENFEKFKYQNKPFVVWLYTIAHNLIIDYYRKNKRGDVSLDSLPFPPAQEEEDVLSKVTKEDLIERINKKTGDLPEELNNIFTLRHTEDLTFSEIAKLLGRTEGAVKMQYYRGLEILKGLVCI